jgi:hypothetical protein
MKRFLFAVIVLASLLSCKSSLITGEWFKSPMERFIFNDGPKSYITLNSGEKIFVEKLVVAEKHTKWLVADGKYYKANKVKNAYIDKTNFFVSIKGSFAKQVASGKLSFYIVGYTKEDGTVFEIDDKSSRYYYQKQGETDFHTAASINELSQMVADCPKAKEKFSGGYFSTLKRMRKDDNSLIYNAIDIYNNDCD